MIIPIRSKSTMLGIPRNAAPIREIIPAAIVITVIHSKLSLLSNLKLQYYNYAKKD
jgi:hypothetical protein